MIGLLGVTHYPAAWPSGGESKMPRGTPPPLQSLPALSGPDSASPTSYFMKTTHKIRLASFRLISCRKTSVGQIPLFKPGDTSYHLGHYIPHRPHHAVYAFLK